MRRSLGVFFLGILLLAGGWADLALGQQRPDDFRRSMGNLRPDSRTAAAAIQGSPPPQSAPAPALPEITPEDGHGGHPGRPGHAHGGGWGRPDYGYGYGYGYDPYAPYGYPAHPYYPPSYWVYPYPPPLYLPGEAIYGPEAVKRFMGFYSGAAPASVDVIVVAGPEQERPAGPGALRGTGADSVALGRKFIGFGDAQFIEQQYAQAYIRYKKAAEAAPQLAQAYFRQGWSLLASGRYELAAAAFKKGLDLDPEWPRSDFRLDELYGPNRLAKTAHIDALAAAAGDEPQNADLFFLVGVFLFFDGQPHRARPFFERLTQLPGGGAPVGGFLEAIEPRSL